MAQATNLVFFIPTSISAIIGTIKDKLIDWKTGIVVAISGVFGAVAGVKVSINMDVQKLKRYFGFFLAFIAIYEIYSIVKKYINEKKKT